MRAETKLFLRALRVECHNYCPALGMCARMWSPLGRDLRAERHIQKRTPCKDMKRQLAETLPSASTIGI